jgi:hypothetical protein
MLWAILPAAGIGLLLAAAVLEIMRLRRRERELLGREAVVQARQLIADEKAALEEAKRKQSFEEGIREGLNRASHDLKADAGQHFEQGRTQGLLEGEQRAVENFRIEYWTEVKKNQGYFFTSAEVVACYQLMYKNIPLGLPQKHVIETREQVDRQAMDQMIGGLLGAAALPPGATESAPNIRVVKREDVRELPAGKHSAK